MKSEFAWLSVVIAGVTLSSASSAQTVRYVDDDASPGGSGTSWNTAFADLQDALNVAQNGDEIWVAEGRYVPSVPIDPSDARTATFRLNAALELYGGFFGDETDRADRDPNSYVSMLSGDINDDDAPDFANYGENSYNVLVVDSNLSIVLDGFTVSGGNADGLTAKAGGGLFVDGALARIRRCRLEKNKANSGGAAQLNNTLAGSEIADCAFVGNQAEFFSGALGVFNATNLSIARCTFDQNTAENSGAMWAGLSRLTVIDCDFQNNSVSQQSGTMRIVDSVGTTLVSGSSFTQNHANGVAGALQVDHSDCIVTGCTFQENSAAFGGAIRLWESTASLQTCSFDQNLATVNGGAIEKISGSATLDNGMFTLNQAGNGGAIIQGTIGAGITTSMDLTGCTFDDNVATGPGNSGGGAIWNDGASGTIQSCQFTGNLAGNWAGGIVNSNGSNVTIDLCTFTGNTASAILNDASSPLISDCTFVGTDGDVSPAGGGTSPGFGGAIANQNGSAPLIQGCDFTSNNATEDGGAIRNDASGGTFENCTFSQNTTSSNGGAIALDTASNPLIRNCAFSANGASRHGGGIAAKGGSDAVVRGSTFDGNTAGDNSQVFVNNSILWRNTSAVGCGEDAQFYTAATAVWQLDYSCVQGLSGALGGIGNIGANPLLAADGRVQPQSPVIDAGDNDAVSVGTTVDVAGNPRFADDPGIPDTGNAGLPGPPIVDIGAYEGAGVGTAPLSVIFVNPAAVGSGDGTDWANAFVDLQAAFAAAVPSAELWLAAGTYQPTTLADPNGPRSATFQLSDCVTIYGGFAGGETDLLQRDPDLNPAILTHDPICSRAIITANGTGVAAVLDGVTIQRPDTPPSSSLEFELVNGAAATIRNCTIETDAEGYLALDPNPASPTGLVLIDTKLKVTVEKDTTCGKEGTLLELRAIDQECGTGVNPDCESGIVNASGSSVFAEDPSIHWVIDELRIKPNAALNLTNRDGFDFRDPNAP